jgi:hypothetical protein
MSSLKPFFSSLCLAALVLLGRSTGSAMSVIPPTFSQLVAQAETVARVEITGQTSQWDTTSTGQKVIHTYVACKVIKQLKGDPQTTLSLRFLGGQVGNDVMEIPDMPKFVTGEHCIVFVAANGRAFCPLVGVMHGKYSLIADASGTEHVQRNNGAALRSTAEVSASDDTAGAPGEIGMNRDDFEAAIGTEVRHASGH